MGLLYLLGWLYRGLGGYSLALGVFFSHWVSTVVFCFCSCLETCSEY